MKNGELKGKNCRLYKNLNLISKKWTIFILMEFYNKKSPQLRYSDLKKEIPLITPRVLSMRLNELVEEKILLKKIEETSKPIPNIIYSLSKSGKDLLPVIVKLQSWGEKHGVCSFEKICKRCNFI